MNDELLLLKNQLCFPLYAASRLVINLYQPLLNELELTYPQYLILLVLWEEDGQTVNSIGGKLLLASNTLTPLLKRMEAKEIILRSRLKEDERKVLISLTLKGKEMKAKALEIPVRLGSCVSDAVSAEKAIALREELKALIKALS